MPDDWPARVIDDADEMWDDSRPAEPAGIIRPVDAPTVEIVDWGADPNPGPVPLWVDVIILTGIGSAIGIFVIWPMLVLMGSE